MKRKEYYTGERILRIDFKSLRMKGKYKNSILDVVS